MSFPDLYIDFFMAAPRGSTMYVRVMNSLYTKKNVNNKPFLCAQVCGFGSLSPITRTPKCT